MGSIEKFGYGDNQRLIALIAGIGAFLFLGFFWVMWMQEIVVWVVEVGLVAGLLLVISRSVSRDWNRQLGRLLLRLTMFLVVFMATSEIIGMGLTAQLKNDFAVVGSGGQSYGDNAEDLARKRDQVLASHGFLYNGSWRSNHHSVVADGVYIYWPFADTSSRD